MTVAERVEQLLAGIAIEDVLRGREVEEAGRLLGVSTATTYRYIGDGRLGHIKLEGERRTGHGHAGAVRVRLLDCIRFQVENEVVPGTAVVKRRAPPGKEKPALLPLATETTTQGPERSDDTAATCTASTTVPA